MRALYARAAEEVQRYGGTIHSVAGTRLLATFGAPIALENHARLALLAALQLQERFAAPCGDLLKSRCQLVSPCIRASSSWEKSATAGHPPSSAT